jgi:hypothetical protein
MRVAEYGHVAVKKREISELKQNFRQNFLLIYKHNDECDISVIYKEKIP